MAILDRMQQSHQTTFSLSLVVKARGLNPPNVADEYAVKKIVVNRETPAETREAICQALTEARIAKDRCRHKVLND